MVDPPTDSAVDPAQLPSLSQLRDATVAALVVLGVLGVTVVLPAEEGIDPTGVGDALGLTPMGQMKNPAPGSNGGGDPQDYAFRSDTITVELAPNQGTEVKAALRSGDQMIYSWESAGPGVFFDFHGEEEGKPSSEFTSFETGTKVQAKGAFEAPFDGVHGWYWKNTSTTPTTVTLTTSGVYRDLKQL